MKKFASLLMVPSVAKVKDAAKIVEECTIVVERGVQGEDHVYDLRLQLRSFYPGGIDRMQKLFDGGARRVFELDRQLFYVLDFGPLQTASILQVVFPALSEDARRRLYLVYELGFTTMAVLKQPRYVDRAEIRRKLDELQEEMRYWEQKADIEWPEWATEENMVKKG